MGAFAIALGSLIVVGTALFGTVVYVLTAASRVEDRRATYAGDHGSNTHEHRNRTQRLRGRGRW